MSKATLIIDMPETCINCPCYDNIENECRVERRYIPFITALKNRTKWCPLSEEEERFIEEIEDDEPTIFNEDGCPINCPCLDDFPNCYCGDIMRE